MVVQRKRNRHSRSQPGKKRNPIRRMQMEKQKTRYKTLNNLKIKSEKFRCKKDNRTEKYVLFPKKRYN